MADTDDRWPAEMRGARRANAIRPGYDELVRVAEADVRVYRPADAIELVAEPGVRFVDVREAVELDGGVIPGAVHASRGLLEAHLDPATSRYVRELGGAAALVCYCAGGSRSALAAQRARELGIDRVGHLAGGIAAWRDAGGAIRAIEDRR